jgi:malonate transporter and related proteins
MFRNALMIGIALGFAVNLVGLPLPEPVCGAID